MIETKVGVEGMACGMCEAHINEAIRLHFGINHVSSSRKKKETDIVSEKPLDPAEIRKVIEGTGYQVTSITSGPYVKKSLFSRLFG